MFEISQKLRYVVVMTREILLINVAALLVCFGVAVNGDPGEEKEKLKTLPEPAKKGAVSVEEAIARRRSVRSYSDTPLTDQEISQILWAAQGITDSKQGFRAAPSAGATYPLETYLVTGEGIFHYIPLKHALEEVRKGDFRKQLAEAALGQGCVRQAPAVIVFAAVPERTTGRYGQRGQMYIHMEAGHAAQNVHLEAVALGLASVPVGAFDEAAVSRALDLPVREKPLYLVPVGKPR